MEMFAGAYQQQEEERARLRHRLSREAIDLALQGRWEEAEAMNRSIVEQFPADAETYNRLGRALTELGDFNGAREAYFRALELSPENNIAKKNIARLSSLSDSMAALNDSSHKTLASKGPSRRVALNLFMTEMGKAGVVDLHNVASGKILARMSFGDQVHLEVKGQRLMVKNEDEEYLGQVEPKQGLRLVQLMKGGNRYDAAILNADEGRAQVVIKEIYQHPGQAGRPSFPVRAEDHLRSRIKESLLRRGAYADEAEALLEIVDDDEADDTGHEDEALPEGFTVVGEDSERGI